MILYTPIPPELIWERQNQETATYQEVQYSGITLLVQQGDNGSGKIVRIISSNPYAYLIPELQPGREVPLLFPQ
ncbi:MAG: Uncharacterized protein XD63_1264 [Thermoanaerobacterales bacterium 50_218]|nr:MAG: Uncharacterized protein XD63_1264 [Thermoanaerobacterales bacterium 50_218]HAA89540.1 hypothetical protein [Peptococcaceae bacterium]